MTAGQENLLQTLRDGRTPGMLYAATLETVLDRSASDSREVMSLLLEFGSDKRLGVPGIIGRLRPYLLQVPPLTRVTLHCRWRRVLPAMAAEMERSGLIRPPEPEPRT